MIIFSNSKLKTLKKIKLDSKARFVFAKKEIIIFSLYIFLTCRKTLKGIILRAIIGSLQEVTVSNFFQ